MVNIATMKYFNEFTEMAIYNKQNLNFEFYKNKINLVVCINITTTINMNYFFFLTTIYRYFDKICFLFLKIVKWVI